MKRKELRTKGGRFVGDVWVDLVAGLYFPEPYSSPLHLSVIRGIRELVEDSKLTFFPTDLPTPKVSKERVDDTDVGGHPVELRWDERDVGALVDQHFVKHIHFSLQGSGRPSGLTTFIYNDSSVVFDLQFGVTGEEATGNGPLFPEDIRELRVIQVLDRIDPFAGYVDVVAFADDIESALAHSRVYLGSSIVRAVGRERLLAALNELAGVTRTPHGGMYISWRLPNWREDSRYKALVSLAKEVTSPRRP
jgi:hypothetical protein